MSSLNNQESSFLDNFLPTRSSTPVSSSSRNNNKRFGFGSGSNPTVGGGDLSINHPSRGPNPFFLRKSTSKQSLSLIHNNNNNLESSQSSSGTTDHQQRQQQISLPDPFDPYTASHEFDRDQQEGNGKGSDNDLVDLLLHPFEQQQLQHQQRQLLLHRQRQHRERNEVIPPQTPRSISHAYPSFPDPPNQSPAVISTINQQSINSIITTTRTTTKTTKVDQQVKEKEKIMPFGNSGKGNQPSSSPSTTGTTNGHHHVVPVITDRRYSAQSQSQNNNILHNNMRSPPPPPNSIPSSPGMKNNNNKTLHPSSHETISNNNNNTSHRPLTKPKSKLRLRLKLTPPYSQHGGSLDDLRSAVVAGTTACLNGQAGMGMKGVGENGNGIGHGNGEEEAGVVVIGKKGQGVLGLGRPGSEGYGGGKTKATLQTSSSENENQPPTSTPPTSFPRQASVTQVRSISSNNSNNTNKAQYPIGNTYPAPGHVGVVRGHNPTLSQSRSQSQSRGEAGLGRDNHIAVQRSALTAQTFQYQPQPQPHPHTQGHGDAHSQSRSSIRTQSQSYRDHCQTHGQDNLLPPPGLTGHGLGQAHDQGDVHIPKLYEPALGVGIHQAPSPEAIRRAGGGGGGRVFSPQQSIYAGTVDSRMSMSTVTPYNSATITRSGDAGQAAIEGGKKLMESDSGRYLSPETSQFGQIGGHPTRSSSVSSQGPQQQYGDSQHQTFLGDGQDRHLSGASAFSSVNLSLTLSRGNSATSLALGSQSPPPVPSTDSSPRGALGSVSPAREVNHARPNVKANGRGCFGKPSKENLRETTPSSFGNANGSFESEPSGGKAEKKQVAKFEVEEGGREILADAPVESRSSEKVWNEGESQSKKDQTHIFGYPSDGDQTVDPAEESSSFLDRDGDRPDDSTVSAPFSQDDIPNNTQNTSEGISRESEDTASTALTEERVSGPTVGYESASGDNSLESGNTSASKARSEGKSGIDGASDIFTITDLQLSEKYKFVKELGFGNWGSVWEVKPKSTASHPLYRHKTNPTLPPLHYSIASQHHPQKLAIKLVHRSKTPTTAARVRALWSEMKIVRSLREAPHPSIIGFDSFIITPSYALVVMPCLGELIPVNLATGKAKRYFTQLASGVAYLHNNGITHNDIKPSNIIISHADVPVLVDFGFAQRWEATAPSNTSSTALTRPAIDGKPYKQFWSEICWGTPEYLSPQRAKGEHHDERLSDVWALGITFFEILCGRTPFEMSEDEDFSTPEQLAIYFDRTVSGEWVGEWSMDPNLATLLHHMIMPSVSSRMNSNDVACDPALAPAGSATLSTPPFVRDAAAYHTHKVNKAAKKRKSIKAETMVETEPQVQQRAQSLERTESKTGPIRSQPLQIAGSKNASNEQHKELPPSAKSHHHREKPTQGGPRQEKPKSAGKQDDSAHQEHGPRQPNNMVTATQDATLDRFKRQEESAIPPKADHVAVENRPPPRPKAEQPEAKQVRRVKDFDAQGDGKGVVRQRFFDQKRNTPDTENGREGLTMRRPASAMALRSVNEFDQIREEARESHRNVPKIMTKAEMQRQALGVENRTSQGSDSRNKNRHVRVVSDSNALQNIAGATWPSRKAVPDFAGSKSNGDKWVHFQTDSEHIPNKSGSSTIVSIAPAVVLRPTSPTALIAAPEALQRLDRIAGWIKDVEKIVANAREALEEAQVETRNSQAISAGEQAEILEIIASEELVESKMTTKTNGPKIRHSRTTSAFSTFAEPATPPGWTRPSVDFEEWQPTHLRRQRSDLTGMNIKSSFKPVISEAAVEHTVHAPIVDRASGDHRRLKTHRSTGDLGRLVRNEDPYDAMLSSQPGIARRGEGWGSVQSKAKDKNAGGFVKKDNGIRGWFKAKFGKK